MQPLSPVLDRYPVRVAMSVLVPAYNEADVIEANVTRIVEYLLAHETQYDWEIVIVDDGSTDGTREIVDAMAAREPRIRAYHHVTNFGLGQALRFGFGQCRGDVIVTLDADLSYSPDHIERLVTAWLTTRARIVVASPYMPGGSAEAVPWGRLVTSRVANVLLSKASNARIATLTGMVRAYDARFLRSLNFRSMGMEVNAEIVRQAQILRARIVEIPAHLDWRTVRRPPSSRGFTVNATTLAVAIATFLFRPVMFFLIPALACALAALTGFGVLVARRYGGDALLAGFTVIAALAAIQLGCFGVLALQCKRSFEDLFGVATATYRRFQEGPRP